MMPAVASGDGSPRTTPRKRTCEPWRAGYGARDVPWPITPIKTAFFKRPARNPFPNNCGEIGCEPSLGEPCMNWGSTRTCGTSTKTPNQNQTQIPCTRKPPLEKTMETDISIWQKPGHFYFALTRSENTKRELLAG